MIEWTKQLRISFLWLICLMYFTQGFRSFVWAAASYQLKDRLKLLPSASQFVFSIAFFPWSMKPLYGSKAEKVFHISLFLWPILGLSVTMRSSTWNPILLLTLQNLGSAMADVVIDAMIAEAVRSERAAFAGDLQSVSWFSMATGGICGSLLGGYALSKLEIHTIFLLFSVLPTIQLFSCGLAEEGSIVSEPLFESLKSENSDLINRNGNVTDDDYSLTKKSDSNTFRRKKSQKNIRMKAKYIRMSQTANEDCSLMRQWYRSLKTAAYSLCLAFKQPIILRQTSQKRSMAWFFLALAIVPNLSTVMFYYQTEFLKLDPAFLGTAHVVSWLGLMIATFIYNRYLKKLKLRVVLAVAHVGLFVLTLLDMALISRSNVTFGISDKTMVLFGSALSDTVDRLKFMPFLILSEQLCPPGIEGTLFARFMSINNLGNTVGSFVGAGLASVLNTSSGSFDNLFLGVGIRVFCTFIPVAFLFFDTKGCHRSAA